MNLNTATIQRRQQQLGQSNRELARRTGISLPWLTRILDGEPHGDLTVQHLTNLADSLACDPADLLANDDSTSDIHPGTSTLIAYLATARRAVPPGTIATDLRYDLATLEALLHAADQQLRSVGLRLHRQQDGQAVSVVPANVLTPRQHEAASRAAEQRLQLSTATAGLVHRICSDPPTAKAVNSSNAGRARLGELINAGIVKRPQRQTDPLALTDAARRSLLLDVR